jgi:hypothetical protein
MPVESRQSESDALPTWTLDDWNRALYRHFFAVAPKEIVAPLTRLYVTSEDLRAAAFASLTPEESRTAFIESVKRALGPRSLALDASLRRKQWNPGGPIPPPFLSHLLLTCMVANDLSEELKWTGNFRDRLSCTLGTHSQPLLKRLRPLWEDLARWSVRQNLEGAGCRPLRLPKVPDSGYHCIIGYSIRLAIPSRRDKETLATLLRQHHFDGGEPDLNSVLHVVGASISKFSAEFEDIFREFASGLKSLPSSVLFHTTFWAAVREVALLVVHQPDRDPTSVKTRLELEDDDGQFWLTLTADTEIQSAEIRSLVLPSMRRSPFRFLLTDTDGKSLVEQAFSSAKSDAKLDRVLTGTRVAVADGVLLFEESEDYVHVLSRSFPSSGRLCALVADRLKSSLNRAVEAGGLRPQVSRSSRPGWSEWRGLTAEGLRRVDFTSFPALCGIRSLRRTLPPPEIRIRGGIQFGTGFVALANALPHVEIAGAESVCIEVTGGDWVPLEALEGTEDCWRFGTTLSTGRLLGTHRIVAFSASVPIAERGISFIENAFTTDYKRPQDPSRWLIESTRIDTIPFTEDATQVTVAPELPNPELWQKDAEDRFFLTPGSPVKRAAPLVELTTLLCTRFAAQRGISEGELLQIMKSALGANVSEVWPILRGWVESGMLDVLADARWRARIYFARTPSLVVHRRDARYEAVLTGLVPPFLLERFDKLSAIAGATPVERRSASEAVPPLPRCRSLRLGLLMRLARELNLPPLTEVRPIRDFVASVRSLTEGHTSSLQDSWPVYRHWDWEKRAFKESPSQSAHSGISIRWCRRDDGPDRYKLCRHDSPIWWTRSRTWAILAAFTLAGVPVFSRLPAGVIESRGDSLYLPLPVARFVSWTGPVNPGPVKTDDGRRAYRYTFADDRLRESVLSGLWPAAAASGKKSSPGIARRFAAAIRAGFGPLVPLPVALRRSMFELEDPRSFRTPVLVPATALPELYAILRATTQEEA